MKLVDANVLLQAVNSDASDHRQAKSWLDSALSGGAEVGFAWLALVAFVRIATRPGIFVRPLTADEALGIVRAWVGAPTARVLHPGARHIDVLATLLHDAGTAGNLTNDAHLAALALEHGAEVVTYDADFDRFPGLRWQRPGTNGGAPRQGSRRPRSSTRSTD